MTLWDYGLSSLHTQQQTSRQKPAVAALVFSHRSSRQKRTLCEVFTPYRGYFCTILKKNKIYEVPL
jgi:hypothetical protein